MRCRTCFRQLYLNVLLGGCIVIGLASAPAEARAGESETVILDTGSFWRRHETFRPLALARPQEAPPDVELTRLAQRAGFDLISYQAYHIGYRFVVKPCSPLPPSDWMQPHFDDRGWWRSPGPYYGGYGDTEEGYHDEGALKAALLCLRGKFGVSDPAPVKELKLSLAYRGGVVVYLNGTEVARAHLSGAKINPETLAEVYPKEAYLTCEGIALPAVRFINERTLPLVEQHKQRYELRLRRLMDVRLPISLLRKGTNVLALEIHRAPHHPIVLTYGKTSRKPEKPRMKPWMTAGFLEAKLIAKGDKGIVPNVHRPEGLQVWNATPVQPIFDVDYGDPNEKLGPIRVVGTPGGTFWGQVVVSSDTPIQGLQAKVSELRRKGGGKSIPASALELRYPLPNTSKRFLELYYPVRARRFDALAHQPPVEIPVRTKRLRQGANWVFGAVQPVWVKIKVSPETSPGDYQGALTINVAGQEPVVVPIHLRVCAWWMPDPRDYVTFLDIVESPEWNSFYYKVPPWSPEHWKLVAEALKILGSIGNNVVYIPLVCQTHLDHQETMVRWVKQSDGSYTYDFTVMDKYLDLVQKHMPGVRAVVLCVFERYMLPASRRRGRDIGVLMSVLDPKTGEVAQMEGPKYSDPEAKAFWQPVTAAVKKRLRLRGLEDAIMLGLVGDHEPESHVLAFWKDMLPEAGWVKMCHSLHGFPARAKLGFAVVAGGQSAQDPDSDKYTDERYRYGWKERYPRVLSSAREMTVVYPFAHHRLVVEFLVQGACAGYGGIAGDFWYNLYDPRTGRYGGQVPNRLPLGHWGGNNQMRTRLLDPGKHGPLSTIRFEMIREGVQECEARIVIEKALVDEKLRAKLPEELVKRCEALIARRTRAALWGTYSYKWYLSSDWQARTEELFNTAGKVEKALRVQSFMEK